MVAIIIQYTKKWLVIIMNIQKKNTCGKDPPDTNNNEETHIHKFSNKYILQVLLCKIIWWTLIIIKPRGRQCNGTLQLDV